MRREELGLEHGPMLQPRLQTLGLDLSTYSFANAFLWRNRGKGTCEILWDEDHCFLRGNTFDGKRGLMLCQEPNESCFTRLQDLLPEVDCLYSIPEEWLDAFPASQYRRESLNAEKDYLFRCEQLAEYPGRKLAGKRNLVRNFKQDREPIVVDLCGSEDGALEVLKQWQERSGQSQEATDYEPCREAIQYSAQLGLKGRLTLVDGHPVGFCIGESLNERTLVLRFAKGLRRYKGIFQFLFQDYARALGESHQWINIEEDLGKEPIRRSKASYKPIKLLPKYRIFPK